MVLSSLNLLSHLKLTTFEVGISFPCLQMNRLGLIEAKEQDHRIESFLVGLGFKSKLFYSRAVLNHSTVLSFQG